MTHDSSGRSGRRTMTAGCLLALGLAGSSVAQIQWPQQVRPDPRTEFAAAFDLARNVGVLFGGFRSGTHFGDTWEWDGADWSRIPLSLAPSARESHCMAFDFARQEIVLFGGQNAAGDRLDDTWTYNGVFWRRHDTGTSGPSAREDARMAYDSVRGEIILFGGIGAIAQQDTWAWNGSSWTDLTPSDTSNEPSPRFRHGMCNDLAGRIYLFGGRAQNGQRNNETWVWQNSGWTQVLPPSSPTAREQHAMAFDIARNRVVMYGGVGGTDETWEFQFGGSWTQPSPAQDPGAASGRSMFFDNSINRTVLFGANSNDDDTWLWSGTDWEAGVLSPTVRRFHAAASDPNGTTVVFGGNASGFSTGTWTWASERWDTQALAVEPSGRTNSAMATDSGAGGGVLLFGGFGSNFLGDTWRWSNGLWNQLSPTNAPSARREHAMVEGPGGAIVLFGGLVSGGADDETWVWNGSDWTNAIPATAPSDRVDHAMAYDSVRDRVVLFGGIDGSTRNNETWEWDGANWTQLSPVTAPSARNGHAMTYDPTRGVVLLHGGAIDGSIATDELWSWDGVEWTQLESVDPLPALSDHVLFHDAPSGRNVIFGGRLVNGVIVRDTWIAAPTLASAFTQTVAGCLCASSGQTASQALAAGSAPRLGSTFTIEVDGLPNEFGTASMLVGFSGTPVPLGALGLTGCTIAVDAPIVISIANTFGSATWAATIPVDNTLLGFNIFTQVLYACPGAAGLGLRFSDARSVTVGTK